jgi:hypothetical protein
MIDCCGITQIIVMNNKKKKIQLMEDDWLKDLQGDVYRCKYTCGCSVVPRCVTYRDKAFRQAMI